jgi:alkanesulfonate monooxygenase SsuD/methylene tetrahydromethanopterin reductase-like flavin-dependent oxidoreductase (luciferase family)
MDHWFQMDQMASADQPMLEGYTTLGYLAAHTSTVRLGLLVTGVTYRHPGLLAKIVATLDVLSGGRGQLGIGAAWYEREHRGLGVPFPPVAERFERLERDPPDLPADVGPLPTSGPTPDGTTSWPRASARRDRSARPARRSSSVAAARRRRCALSPATATPATSSPPDPPMSPTRSTCWPATATRPP